MPGDWTENDAALAALVNLVVVLADNKYYLGRRLSEWVAGAPSLEEGVSAAAIVQEELGHARVLYPLLEELPFPHRPQPLEREQDRQRRYAVSYVDSPWPAWPHAVAALALIDTAITTMLEHLSGSSYEALARRVGRILHEESFHMAYAEGRVRSLCETEAGRRLLQEQVDVLLPEMLLWFGPPGEAGVEALRSEGLVAGDNEAWRQSYLGRVAPLLLEVGVRLPLGLQWDLAHRRWEWAELPWERWNRLQRRLEKAAVRQ
ncbi:1,2-phenylacetyl-CoA epoxidase, subunit A [bacterium HR24]|jgi:phenylacetate-CoA oxygenase PaaI subunit|nr:1,2-phenylacetyl-CoA epoxidase, subunit A [bacterium HR24]